MLRLLSVAFMSTNVDHTPFPNTSGSGEAIDIAVTETVSLFPSGWVFCERQIVRYCDAVTFVDALKTVKVILLQIDDKEFDLPEITSPQTLESILNEPDDDVFMDELVSPELLQGEEQGDTVSMSSNEGILDSNRTPTKRK